MQNCGIYSGYVKEADSSKIGGLSSSEWAKLWLRNTFKDKTYPVFIFGPDYDEIFDNYSSVTKIAEYSNLGHIGDYLHGKKRGDLCGWTSGILYGLIHAYVNNLDFVYKEQDCLWFGPCLEELYKQIGDSTIIFGSCQIMINAQSLFLVKHESIIKVIHAITKYKDIDKLPEYKFFDIPNHKRFNFGYDRDRPFNINDHCWYIQQVSAKELNFLKSKNLIN